MLQGSKSGDLSDDEFKEAVITYYNKKLFNEFAAQMGFEERFNPNRDCKKESNSRSGSDSNKSKSNSNSDPKSSSSDKWNDSSSSSSSGGDSKSKSNSKSKSDSNSNPFDQPYVQPK